MSPVRPLERLAAPRPAADYAEAEHRLASFQALEKVGVNPLCRTQLLTHGRQVSRVFVLLHGFTNCPHQFCQFGTELYNRGANVLNVRLPRHGMADPLTDQLAYLTAEEMATAAGDVIDLAHGLGERVTLFGFSLGGILAGWAAHHRPDLDTAILASPALGVRAISPGHSQWLAALLTWLPNSYRWWDPRGKRAGRGGPAHAYPRYATRGLAALLRLGCIIQAEARVTPPVVRQVIVITNPCDKVVDNATTAATVAAWRGHGATIQTYEFPPSWQLIHDLIDPAQPQQQVARVYPLLLEWVWGIGE